MQFLWFYVPGPDNGFELRHSMRSVLQHFQGNAHLTVIGDRPDWYKGHHIPCPKISARPGGDRVSFLDTQHKITVASTHPEIHDEFVWIMDDVFLLRDVTIEDLKVPRYDPWYKPMKHKMWHRLIGDTFRALSSRGFGNLQYGTHLPHHIEKQKLVEMFAEFDYPKRLLLWEILYGNRYRSDAVEYRPFLVRLLNRPRKEKEIEEATSESSVLNYQSTCFSDPMRRFLHGRFAVKSGCEL